MDSDTSSRVVFVITPVVLPLFRVAPGEPTQKWVILSNNTNPKDSVASIFQKHGLLTSPLKGMTTRVTPLI